MPLDLSETSLLLVAEASAGWQAHWSATDTVDYLNAHHLDGIARLWRLGDLVVLGATPVQGEAMNAEEDCLPAWTPG